MHGLTEERPFLLRVDATDFHDNSGYALYRTFQVGSLETQYRLTATGFINGSMGKLSWSLVAMHQT